MNIPSFLSANDILETTIIIGITQQPEEVVVVGRGDVLEDILNEQISLNPSSFQFICGYFASSTDFQLKTKFLFDYH